MRVAVFLFVCFAASTAFSTHRNNPVASEHEVNATLVPDEWPSANNSLLNRQLRQDDLSCGASEEEQKQEEWCNKLEQQPIPDVLAKCKSIASDAGYVLRVDQNVDKEAWKKFSESLISLDVDVEIIGTSLTEINFNSLCDVRKALIISNNPSLKTINTTPKQGRKTDFISKKLEIKGNKQLSSVQLNGQWLFVNLTISDNEMLEKFEINSHALKLQGLHLENNPKLATLTLKAQESRAMGPIRIIQNSALTTVDFDSMASRFSAVEVKIVNNDNLEKISIKTPKDSQFSVATLEIRKNGKLKEISLGKTDPWKHTDITVRDNPLLPASNLGSIRKNFGRKETKDIQEVGEGLSTTTTTTTVAPEPTTTTTTVEPEPTTTTTTVEPEPTTTTTTVEPEPTTATKTVAPKPATTTPTLAPEPTTTTTTVEPEPTTATKTVTHEPATTTTTVEPKPAQPTPVPSNPVEGNTPSNPVDPKDPKDPKDGKEAPEKGTEAPLNSETTTTEASGTETTQIAFLPAVLIVGYSFA